MQNEMDFGQPRQFGLDFPTRLTDKYQPKLKNFLGLDAAKRAMLGFLGKPMPCAILAVGPPGTGKSVMGMALAEELPATLYHIKAQTCTADALEAAWFHFHHYPAKGKFHLALIEEGDQMTDKAQLQWLSYGDSGAGLKPTLMGGFERGEAPPVIWFITANGRGERQTEAPTGLHPRFVQRCLPLAFEPPPQAQIAQYLRFVWEKEGGPKKYPDEFFLVQARGLSVRDSLNRLEVELMAPRTAKEVRLYLEEQRAQVEQAEARKWQAELDNAPDPERSAAAKKAWQTMRANDQNRAALTGGAA